jgi:hypothetical protein
MKNLTPELIKTAKAAKSVEELFELAKTNNVEITEEEAKTYFTQLNAGGEIADDELDAVAGGNDDNDCFSSSSGDSSTLFYFGDRVRVIDGTVCTSCGTSFGVIDGIDPSSRFVKCTKCNIPIISTINPSKIEKL